MYKKKTTLPLVTLSIFVIFIIVYLETKKEVPLPPLVAEPETVTISYLCSENKKMTAKYHFGKTILNAQSDSAPTPTGSVTLTLSENKTITLPQTISADGARYANTDETILFWSKGEGALFEENGKQNYKNCIILLKDPGNLPNEYKSEGYNFTMRYPSGYRLNEQYLYTVLGPKKEIKGVSFTVASSSTQGTNLSTDSYLSIESKDGTVGCSASLFLQPGAATSTKVEGTNEYSYGTTADAGAGNRYDETIYAFPHGTSCFAVRYFIHYSVFENYPAGSIKEFDKAALITTFDTIRKSITIN